MATPLRFITHAPVSEQNPAVDLFDLMTQRFGQTLSRINAKRNTFICNQGAKLANLFLIQEGEIVLTRLSADGQETLIGVLGPGEFFGEGALLSGSRITFSAKTTRQSVLLQLPERKFKLFLEEQDVCRMLLESVARRCDDAWTQMEVLACTHVRNKVRAGLLWLSERMGVETHEGVRIDLNQTQLARMVGCARETLSREVSELRKIRAIEVRQCNGRKAFFLVNPGELQVQN
jgi:CRP/FNR family transcriptional regulator, cyclic AMP receptor protein